VAGIFLIGLGLVGCTGGDRKQPVEANDLAHVPSKLVPIVVAGDATSPAADGRFVAWTIGAADLASTKTRVGALYVKDLATGRVYRVNPLGTLASTGGIDRGRLAYEQSGDLALYDLRTRTPEPLPPGINTPQIEWRPFISGRLLLFGRIGDGYKIFLYDFRTRRLMKLDEIAGHGAYAVPGQVNGRFAIWTACPDNACAIYRYDILLHKVERLSNGGPPSHAVYAPSVASNGTAYFARSALGCGSDVALMRYSERHSVSRVLTLPVGLDFQYSYVQQRRSGLRVFIDLYDCRTKRSAIYAIDRRG
jgi:hypothetical protein